MVIYAPVALFVYNRPWHVRQTVEALLANAEAKDTDLHIFADAAKDGQATKAVSAVRSYINEITGFKSVNIIERETNLGLARSIIDGVTQMCNQYGRVIVLEDDLVTSPYFLKFMNDGLVSFADDERVISISGYTYPVADVLPETFFLRGADCWGWATWKRGWDLFEQDGQYLLEQLIGQKLADKFDFDDSYPYVRMLKSQIAGKNNSWAIRWYASAFLKNKLTLYPGSSLVLNIGLDGSGTHCSSTVVHEVDLARAPIRVGTVPVEESAWARQAFIAFHLKSHKNVFIKAYRKVAAAFKRRIGYSETK